MPPVMESTRMKGSVMSPAIKCHLQSHWFNNLFFFMYPNLGVPPGYKPGSTQSVLKKVSYSSVQGQGVTYGVAVLTCETTIACTCSI